MFCAESIAGPIVRKDHCQDVDDLPEIKKQGLNTVNRNGDNVLQMTCDNVENFGDIDSKVLFKEVSRIR